MNPAPSTSAGPVSAPIRNACGTFELLRAAAGYNFVASCMVALGWIGYGAYKRLPVDEECLGIRAEIGIPAWLDCAFVVFILLLVFFRRRDAVAWKLRLLFIGVGAWGFIWSLVLPFLFQSPLFRDTQHLTFDAAVGWYAFASTVVFGLIGPSEHKKQTPSG